MGNIAFIEEKRGQIIEFKEDEYVCSGCIKKITEEEYKEASGKDIKIGNYAIRINEETRRIECIRDRDIMKKIKIVIYEGVREEIDKIVLVKVSSVDRESKFKNKEYKIGIDELENNGEKERFEYMVNYGVDIEGIEFMSYRTFLERFVKDIRG